jgi:hypothetical protein
MLHYPEGNMPRLDLDADNVKEESLTVTEIRAMDSVLTEKMEGWLDEVQGEVFGGTRHKEFYLVIKVTE